MFGTLLEPVVSRKALIKQLSTRDDLWQEHAELVAEACELLGMNELAFIHYRTKAIATEGTPVGNILIRLTEIENHIGECQRAERKLDDWKGRDTQAVDDAKEKVRQQKLGLIHVEQKLKAKRDELFGICHERVTYRPGQDPKFDPNADKKVAAKSQLQEVHEALMQNEKEQAALSAEMHRLGQQKFELHPKV